MRKVEPIPTDADVAAVTRELEQGARRAVCLRPSPHPVEGVQGSYFGGLPRLPPGAPWPRVRNGLIPATFVAQIRLADIPDFSGRDELPEFGVLYFFVDSDFDESKLTCAVLYYPGDASRYEEALPPADLARLRDVQAARLSSQPAHAIATRDVCYSFAPIVVTSYCSWNYFPYPGGRENKEKQAKWEIMEAAWPIAYSRLQMEALEIAGLQTGAGNWWWPPRHQMFGYGWQVQFAPIDRKDQVLLLQVAGDGVLAGHDELGCILQFWITHENLSARRFDRTEVTIECD